MDFPDSICPECSTFTLGGSRVRHAAGCSLRRPVARARSVDPFAGQPVDQATTDALRRDFATHDDDGRTRKGRRQ